MKEILFKQLNHTSERENTDNKIFVPAGSTSAAQNSLGTTWPYVPRLCTYYMCL